MENNITTNQNWIEENDDVYFLEANKLMQGLTKKQFIKCVQLYIKKTRDEATLDFIDQLVSGLNELIEEN